MSEPKTPMELATEIVASVLHREELKSRGAQPSEVNEADRRSGRLCDINGELIAAALISAGEEIERLKEALKPFAAAGSDLFCKDDPDARVASIGRWTEDDPPRFYADIWVTVGDLRAARALISPQQETDNG